MTARTCRFCGQPIQRTHTCAGPPAQPRITRRPDQRADTRQQDNVRHELHTIIDRLIDAWPTLERHARDMTRGYPTTNLDGPGGTSEHTTVERQVIADLVDHQTDPAFDAHQALLGIDVIRLAARRLDGRVRNLLPRPTRETPTNVDEERRIAQCADCGEWILRGDLRRIDGQPYHATSCFFRVWRSQRSA